MEERRIKNITDKTLKKKVYDMAKKSLQLDA